MTKNIKYETPHLAEYFRKTRRKWEEFYASERWIFSRVGTQNKGFGHVLDVGCAVGGLGRALTEKYDLDSYLGLDINEQAIKYAQDNNDLPVEARFLCEDIVTSKAFNNKKFDTVFALSVADWNVDTIGIVNSCWDKVKPGGNMIMSQRLTNKETVLDDNVSFQYIFPNADYEMPEDRSLLEKAPYVVLNVTDCLKMLMSLSEPPSNILAYGYWGPPSKTATTPYKKIAFTVLCMTKSVDEHSVDDLRLETHLPANLFC